MKKIYFLTTFKNNIILELYKIYKTILKFDYNSLVNIFIYQEDFNDVLKERISNIFSLLFNKKSNYKIYFINTLENIYKDNKIIINDFTYFYSSIKLNVHKRSDYIFYKITNYKSQPFYKHFYKLPYDLIYYLSKNKLDYFKEVSSYLDDKRYNHSLSVANLAYNIALNNRLKRPLKYFLAGILHDIGKNINMELQESIMNKYFKKYINLNKYIYHQFVSYYLIKNKFNIKDKNILNAVLYHTTGNKNMDSLSKIVYLSDKIEPTRGYDSSEMIKQSMSNYKNGFIIVLEDSIKYYNNNNIDYHNKLTDGCIKKYLKGEKE